MQGVRIIVSVIMKVVSQKFKKIEYIAYFVM